MYHVFTVCTFRFSFASNSDRRLAKVCTGPFSTETSSIQHCSASTSYLGNRWHMILDLGSRKPVSPCLDTASATSNISRLSKDVHWDADVVHFTVWPQSFSLEDQDIFLLCYSGFWEEGKITYFCRGISYSIAKLKTTQIRILPDIICVMQLLRTKEKYGVLDYAIQNAYFPDFVPALNWICTRKRTTWFTLFCSLYQEVLLNLKKNCAKLCLFS